MRGRAAIAKGARRATTAVAALLAATLAFAAGPARAQYADDRSWVHVAGYRPKMASIARSDILALDRPGTEVNFERELGLDEWTSLPWFQAGVRAGERWRFELEYFALRRDGLRSTTREIAWGDQVYPAFAAVASSFDSDVVRASAGYAFVRTGTTELGGVLGLHVTRFRVSLALAAGFGTSFEAARAEAEQATVPLPTLGVFVAQVLAPAWSMAGRIDYFTLKYGDYDGGLVNAGASLVYRLTERFSLSGGYRYVDYRLDVTRPQWRGGIRYRFSGPFIGFNLGF